MNEEVDPLSAHLLGLHGQKWRNLRVKLTPAFTSGKLKAMFSTIRDCGLVLENYLEKNLKEGKNVFEFRDLLARLTTNMISSVSFGVENDSINDRENMFRKMGMKIFEPCFDVAFKEGMRIFFPDLFIRFKLHAYPKAVEEFIFSMVKQTIGHREKNNYERKDLLQLLIQLKNQGYVSADKDELKSKVNELDKSSDITKLTFNQIVAQCFIFFLGGKEDYFFLIVILSN